MFYTFRQNNSGGSFDFDYEKGITVNVIIEADSLDEVLLKAAGVGIYFNGCDKGLDCQCCGDRWDEPWEGDGDEVPSIYGEPVLGRKLDIKWAEPGREIAIHYKDGRIEWRD